MKSNVILIGMPDAGKSTIGILLAKRLGLAFIDTDVLIQTQQGEILQTTLDRNGYKTLRAIEEQVLLALNVSRTIIETGGSAVYSSSAMAHLASGGVIVYLAAEIGVLQRRISNYATRGIARGPDQTFSGVFEERTRLYRQYAEITVDAGQATEVVVAALEKALLDHCIVD